MKYDERGISLVLTFLIMAIMLAIVVGISSMLSGQVKIMAGASNSISALYAAESGMERALYVFKKCPGCDLNYDGAFDGRTYFVNAKMIGGVLNISSKGVYKEASRTVTR
ncbi:MAG: hypothetical protein A3C50_02665 [Candidatus Staskawiczbacteria bacterium RIFCSPHIGHO2_02_FULL_43_16]|uniref:Type 4 fimbrial biogenesis protein PilX N-terminal domain-containing protein n=1 Tax=Candidatus Staskawiczbacteria bacterium RIFCSPHIGHO2_01_FULL_41_41 TaxID=1802203 RepID=A0A1G2HVA4_9BACT|nr:MAG: hypothetical protein A2822_01425 [Candidatus Staskawiczbacteria bacterium RIFCSPHIGHO2_01_FULL_41_41]OGZ68186.1 MAG: hypothetical protein A3C50_02665 [Candidatus Staskawiczbacteria bacterium RIFCSPHIGHO2_02_FULL_43_16]OGZ74976.1 MAG: hypothetical protein A3A12_04065 [Candidatus Staskawiczbacteria bacterium RIFCSPLOWO2_01_FULL_43_17b]